jgi:hypothetical protein
MSDQTKVSLIEAIMATIVGVFTLYALVQVFIVGV